MDDEQLDDSIKKKVEKFEGEPFDPSAFSALRFRMESAQMPFHTRYRTELMIASALAIVTFIILLSQWMVTKAHTEALMSKMNGQEAKIEKLQQEVYYWKALPPDTIQVIHKDENVYRYQYLLSRISKLESELLKRLKDDTDTMTRDGFITPDEPDGEYAFQKMNSDLFLAPAKRIRGHSAKSMKAQPRKFETSERPLTQLSADKIRDIENHYHLGMGIKLGPSFELTGSRIHDGTGNVNTNVGILVDFILSPSLSLESGATYGHRDYYYNKGEVEKIGLPATDLTLGNLNKAEIDSWLIELPVALKYRYPFSLKTNGLVGVGYSAFIFREQAFDYSYEYAGNSELFINSVYESKDLKFYPGTVNFSLGLSRQIKDQRIEASLGFKKGIQTIGLEKTQANFFTLKTVFWFTVK